MSDLGGIALALLRPPARVADRAAMRLLDQILAAGVADQIATRLLEGPEIERIVTRAIDSPAAERMVARVIESRLLDEAVARLLESKDLWLLVDEVARSPSVTQAISHQSVGFAEEMAGVMRSRSQRADARLERIARRVLRREALDDNGS